MGVKTEDFDDEYNVKTADKSSYPGNQQIAYSHALNRYRHSCSPH